MADNEPGTARTLTWWKKYEKYWLFIAIMGGLIVFLGSVITGDLSGQIAGSFVACVFLIVACHNKIKEHTETLASLRKQIDQLQSTADKLSKGEG